MHEAWILQASNIHLAAVFAGDLDSPSCGANARTWPSQVVCIPVESAQQKFESPPLPKRMDTGFPKKLLTFSAKYGDERVSKSA
jgi:hypothetical protein